MCLQSSACASSHLHVPPVILSPWSNHCLLKPPAATHANADDVAPWVVDMPARMYRICAVLCGGQEEQRRAREREERAAAAERRVQQLAGGTAAPATAHHASPATTAACSCCDSCGASLAGRTPFSRLAYKYCTTACVRAHKSILDTL
ncbi:unnamed protein product [Closterium sp. NIES-53]